MSCLRISHRHPDSAAGVSREKFPSHVTLAHSPRVFGLDLLRAVAILSVVFTHDFVVLYAHMPWWFGVLGHGGFYGVELFFVLSGFLIGRILIRSGSDLSRTANVAVFYVRRWFRTLPLFWLFLGVNVLLEFYLRDRRLSLSEVAGHGFFLRTFAGFHVSFFPESWSLAIEEWFYLLFPAVLWLGLRFWKRFDAVFLFAATAFFLFSTIGRMLSAPNPNATWTEWQRMIVIYRFDGLMIGMFAAWLSFRVANFWRARALLCACAGCLLLIAMYATLWKIVDYRLAFGDDSYFARTFRFTFVSLGFALLLPIASNWKLARETFFSTAIRRIALWSYALYLVHLPVFQLVTRYFCKEWKTSAPQAFTSFSVQIVASITISALLYRFFESRCTHLRNKVAPAVARLVEEKGVRTA
jgi:peptidoglycan/LPS O-acetylase OafA/YrhL